MPLTDKEIRAAKPQDKPYRLFDGGGLYLEISTSGGKLWRLKYRYGDKEKRLSFGMYPDVPLAGRKDAKTGRWIDGARDRREAARQLLASGVDPGAEKKAIKATKDNQAANSFEVVAREWLERFGPQLKQSSADRKLTLLERDVFPWIGKKPIVEVTAPDILGVLRRIEKRGAAETAARARMYCAPFFSMSWQILTAPDDRRSCHIATNEGACVWPITIACVATS